MSILHILQENTAKSLGDLFGENFTSEDFQVNQTKPEFEGEYTIVLFSLVKRLKQSPDEIGNKLGAHLVEHYPQHFSGYNIIKGFLNLSVSTTYWQEFLHKNHADICFGKHPMNGKKVMVEYSSPNTNKPLHLGHLRNNFLGWSVAEILKATGYEVIKSSIVNDRGIHICKSMIAWKKWANGETPADGKKGDHLVGYYYVLFENELKKEAAELLEKENAGDLSHYAESDRLKVEDLRRKKASLENDGEKNKDKIIKIADELTEMRRGATPIMQEARRMLFDWEAGNEEVLGLWRQMNGWVYEGFDTTYRNIGSDFDIVYYESDTYLLGKKIVEEGLAKHVFVQDPDGSVWIDLTSDGLDRKIVQRKDGTSVYITQDIGLAQRKYEEYGIDRSIYVIGDEQNYHMKVLKLIAEKLGLPNAENIYHLSYGMVELPSGKMKSREGTVVDADDLVAEMIATAKHHTEELGKVKDFDETSLSELFRTIGLGAMKFYLLRVDPKKRMIFNPEESIDFHGFTGPFIQYTYARIKSILRKESAAGADTGDGLLELEKALLVSLEQYPATVLQASKELNPSVIAGYIFQVAKVFNSFYTVHSVANAETPEKKNLRLQLSVMTANVLSSGMKLLGIQVPERM